MTNPDEVVRRLREQADAMYILSPQFAAVCREAADLIEHLTAKQKSSAACLACGMPIGSKHFTHCQHNLTSPFVTEAHCPRYAGTEPLTISDEMVERALDSYYPDWRCDSAEAFKAKMLAALQAALSTNKDTTG